MPDRPIIALTLGLNGLYLTALFGFIAVRLLSGHAPVPEGFGAVVMGSAVSVSMICIGLGNFLRLRRGP